MIAFQVLTVLVSGFSEQLNEVTIRHLASIRLSAATAEAIYEKLVAVFESYNLPFR